MVGLCLGFMFLVLYYLRILVSNISSISDDVCMSFNIYTL